MNKILLGNLFLLIYMGVSAAVFCLAAGRWDFPLVWVFFGLNATAGTATTWLLARYSPGLVEERLRPGPGEQDRWFKLQSTILTVFLLVLAGLDAGRYHWTAPIRPAVQIGAIVASFVCYCLMTWAVFTNRFFSIAVRLQPDRKQVVVKTGPYRYVRHPGYAAGLPYIALQGLALGSPLASVLGGLPFVWMLYRRTLLEDGMSMSGLPGYAEYAERVRYRWIPGLW